MKFNFSLDTAIIISLIAIFLFVSGQAYLGGLLHTFYVDPIVLGFSVQDKIYWGYIKGLNPIAYSLLIIFCYFFIRYIDTSLEIRSRMSEKIANFVRKKIDFRLEHKPYIHNQISKTETENGLFSSIMLMAIIYGLFLSSLHGLSHLEKKGSSSGKLILNNIKELPLVRITGAETSVNQYRILCGSILCAVIDEEKNVSLVEPKNVIYLSSNFAEKPEKKSS
ncbi:hypothetical protein KTH73_01485 [Acinetobacter courvalinii]|uniref:hypothetical protein n=1 Tax=Acinetobacter courvalinii TaxID=280147 RepID=UPI0021CD2B75|nr:hypothetical protein [Acinetobacter courvalinii]MCU4389391.1 hypothetical protein [Acinetobacter courvalinii]